MANFFCEFQEQNWNVLSVNEPTVTRPTWGPTYDRDTKGSEFPVLSVTDRLPGITQSGGTFRGSTGTRSNQTQYQQSLVASKSYRTNSFKNTWTCPANISTWRVRSGEILSGVQQIAMFKLLTCSTDRILWCQASQPWPLDCSRPRVWPQSQYLLSLKEWRWTSLWTFLNISAERLNCFYT